MSETARGEMVHLSYALGGCASASHPDAVTDPANVGRVTCPICLGATR
jgi:hypothetical protein